MIIRIASDLHYEFHADKGATLTAEIQDGNFDALILAGDIADCAAIFDALALICKSVSPKPVIYVPGNHEFYGGDWNAGISEIRRAALKHRNLQVLEDSVTELDGHRFVGCTLWYPWSKSNNFRRQQEDKEMGDFAYISDARNWMGLRSKESAKFLQRTIKSGDVVVTHFLPHPASIHSRYADNPSNRYFLHDLGGLVGQGGAKLWIHGHTHCSVDQMIGGTRLICNPFGYAHRPYPNEPNPAFISDFDVEL